MCADIKTAQILKSQRVIATSTWAKWLQIYIHMFLAFGGGKAPLEEQDTLGISSKLYHDGRIFYHDDRKIYQPDRILIEFLKYKKALVFTAKTLKTCHDYIKIYHLDRIF